MQLFRILAAVAFAPLLVTLPVEPVAQSDPPAVTELEGTWEGRSSTAPAVVPPAQAPGLVVLTFRGGTLTALRLLPDDPVTGPPPMPEPQTLSFRLNTASRPKQMDYWRDPLRVFQAVYEVERSGTGRRLKMAIPRTGATCGWAPLPRPQAPSAEANCVILLELEERGTPRPRPI